MRTLRSGAGKRSRSAMPSWKAPTRPSTLLRVVMHQVRLRHTSLTHEAAAGSTPIAIMAKAGHTDMKVTRRYLHLAGIVFRDEADALERRLGLAPLAAVPATSEPAATGLPVSKVLEDGEGSASQSVSCVSLSQYGGSEA